MGCTPNFVYSMLLRCKGWSSDLASWMYHRIAGSFNSAPALVCAGEDCETHLHSLHLYCHSSLPGVSELSFERVGFSEVLL